MTVAVVQAGLFIRAMDIQPVRRQRRPFLVVYRPVKQLEIGDSLAMVSEQLNLLVLNAGILEAGGRKPAPRKERDPSLIHRGSLSPGITWSATEKFAGR